MEKLPPEFPPELNPSADAAPAKPLVPKALVSKAPTPGEPEPMPVHIGPTHPARPERSTSMGFVYFMLAFTLAAFGSMMLLMLLRPMLGELGKGARFTLMIAPLGLGVFYGSRVAMLGVRENLRLSAALKRGLGLRA